MTSIVTAEEIMAAGRKKERDAIVAFINREAAGVDEDTRFVLQSIVGAIRAGGHWVDR